uniref:Envelope glycoprotein 4 n=1 Tax=Porcine reproductive and respiratory syndrome virus TaxID=28344 RepID=A0A144LSU4_PRRSV|nr:envelope glycoprotein 4 [Porcine reproductive and respiratory syndrome virus]AMT92319.1 envelope glycoprotein 4 [Porcine reproductive and respiratory syndrome virus]AMT92329.1 envelope glycoprotein 4 [Porcine reproductive and respiratory syndrome virus]AMT92339.1 envelope glycoprotein 4 [Porcine reproductive and respiratory syndrome virus]APQ46184.1 envelope glycoprotein 4 [Porcine reproductive and respiratory syndrome virus]
MAASILLLLVGFERFLVSQAFACKPCFSSSLSDIKTNTTAAAGFITLQDVSCLRHGDTSSPALRKIPQCRTAIGTPVYITITANVTDENYLHSSDLLMLSSCLFYASEMSEKGFKVVFGNVSGIVAVCVNFTSYVQHVMESTQRSLVVDHVRLLHFMTPETMRWATVLACLFAILLAI